ncbi:MAG: ATP-dependent DNA helicase, partial [Alphaproteobacteria bacterium]|nr:ATP-dependent DNA helicase [Alphaproteobacteria bacterium]
MNANPEAQPRTQIELPDIPALAVDARQAYILSAEGELQTLSHAQAAALMHKKSVLVCHGPYVRSKLSGGADAAAFYAFDALELFAFVHPGAFCVPTIPGLCNTLGLCAPESTEDHPFSLLEIVRALLEDVRKEAMP